MSHAAQSLIGGRCRDDVGAVLATGRLRMALRVKHYIQKNKKFHTSLELGKSLAKCAPSSS
jgi:hypothetical protein